MKIKSLFTTLAILLTTLTFFALDTLADTEFTSDEHTNSAIIRRIIILVIVLIPVGIVCYFLIASRKGRAFLKVHSSRLSSEDPKELLELAEKCEEYLKKRQSDEVANLFRQAQAKIDDIFLKEHSAQFSSKDPKVLLGLTEKCEEYLKKRQSDEVANFSRLAKAKASRLQKEIDLETFKSEISEEGSHPAVVATLKEQMHNPDSFQHVSSDYEIVKKRGKQYHKVVMTFRGRNTFNALVLQTCYFLIDADNQVSLVGSPDDTESSPVNTAQLAASADAAAIAVEGVATLADLLSFFTSEE